MSINSKIVLDFSINQNVYVIFAVAGSLSIVAYTMKNIWGKCKNCNLNVRLDCSRSTINLFNHEQNKNSVQRNKYPPSLFKRLLNKYNLDGKVKALEFGKQHEEDARKYIATNFPRKNIQRAGLYLDKSGVLAASPDGIFDGGVLEIKCPFSFKDKTVDEGIRHEQNKNKKKNGEPKLSQWIIMLNDTGEYIVNKKHEYFHQVQGQMYLTGKDVCFFCIWTPKDAQVFQIDRDPTWEINLNILLTFYYGKLLPEILRVCSTT